MSRASLGRDLLLASVQTIGVHLRLLHLGGLYLCRGSKLINITSKENIQKHNSKSRVHLRTELALLSAFCISTVTSGKTQARRSWATWKVFTGQRGGQEGVSKTEESMVSGWDTFF